MKILHVTPAYFPATYWGGPIYSVYGLCNALARIPGVSLKVLTTDAASPSRKDSIPVTSFPMSYAEGYDVFFCRRWWGANLAPGMILHLWPMIRWADVVHLTAVYSPPTIPTLLFCRLLRKPVVWSPRGALQRWEGASRPLAKRIWEWVCNILVLSGRCVLHVTSGAELNASEKRIPGAVARLIPNGVDCPEVLPEREWKPNGVLRILYIGRLHQIKGIENLLLAMPKIKTRYSLTICGSGDESYRRSLQRLVDDMGLDQRVNFQGQVAGDEKEVAFSHADVCVVPSFTENYGMVVAEALAHGVPVIASRGTPWKSLEQRGCGLWVENTPDSLAQAIEKISEQGLEGMGRIGREWVRKDLDWESVSKKMFSLYQESQSHP